jgi:predicted methyltransferase
VVVLSWYQAQDLLAARAASKATARVSLDLNRSKTTVAMDEQGVQLPDGSHVGWDDIEEIYEDRKHCYYWDGRAFQRIQVFSEQTRLMRTLFPTASAPTMMVSGFPMHRIKGSDPYRDTITKLNALGRLANCRLLDTATGLGYTAIEAARRGARVVTVEIDLAAVEIARLNPWSQELFEGYLSERIERVVGDARDVVAQAPDRSFHAILHDPPSIQLAGELYSTDLYRGFARILRDSGRLFHYTGDPQSALGERTTRSVMRRLHEAGFSVVRRVPEAFGVVAEKSVRPYRRRK